MKILSERIDLFWLSCICGLFKKERWKYAGSGWDDEQRRIQVFLEDHLY